MRIAAGIIMIIFGVLAVSIFGIALSDLGIDAFVDLFILPATLVSIILAGFFVAGGIVCLKRKYWKLCFISSLLLFPFMILLLNSLPPPGAWLRWFLIPAGVLPIVFVCVRKREWSESQA